MASEEFEPPFRFFVSMQSYRRNTISTEPDAGVGDRLSATTSTWAEHGERRGRKARLAKGYGRTRWRCGRYRDVGDDAGYFGSLHAAPAGRVPAAGAGGGARQYGVQADAQARRKPPRAPHHATALAAGRGRR